MNDASVDEEAPPAGWDLRVGPGVELGAGESEEGGGVGGEEGEDGGAAVGEGVCGGGGVEEGGEEGGEVG